MRVFKIREFEKWASSEGLTPVRITHPARARVINQSLPGKMMMADKHLNVMHETAKGLHQAGTLDAMTMREFDALRIPPVKSYTPAQIRSLRTRYKTSQAVFAIFLNISPSTVQKWEQGKKKPNGTSLKLLNLIDVHGLEALA